MNLREKISVRMFELERKLIAGEHLTPEGVNDVNDAISQVSKFWSALGGDDRDFINCARLAVDQGIAWTPTTEK